MIEKYIFFLILLLSISTYANPELLDASRKGDTNRIKQLIENGADINFRDHKSKRTALLEAIESDRLDNVKVLLDNGADPNGIAYENYKVLCTAAKKSSEEIVKLLIERGAKLDSESGVVTWAAVRGQLVLLEWLLNHGGDVNEDFFAYGLNPLNAAIDSGNMNIAIFLIKKGADVNHIHKFTGATPLMTAAITNKTDFLKLLIENGADSSYKDKNGKTAWDYAKTDKVRMIFILADKKTGPFFNAVFSGDVQAIKQKISEGFDVNTRDIAGTTALIYSASSGNIDMVKLLLSCHADVNVSDRRGINALNAATEAKNEDIVKMLLAAGAKPCPAISNKVNDKIDFSLFSAIQVNDLSKVRDLIESGADINKTCGDNRKITPLLAACMFGSAEMVDFLIKKDARLDAIDIIGRSPLVTAASAGKADIVKLLWKKYQQPLFSGKWTALGIASDNGQFEVVKFLVENGADVNMSSTDNNISPLMSAYRNPEITEYLIKHGANIEHEGGILNSTALSLAVRNDPKVLASNQINKIQHAPEALENQMKKQAETHLRQLSVIEILLKAGAAQNHRDKSGKSPRDYVVNPDTRKLLDKYNFNVSDKQ